MTMALSIPMIISPLFPQCRTAGVQEKETEGFSQQICLDLHGGQCGQQSRCCCGQNSGFPDPAVQIAVFSVEKQPGGGGGQKEQQVDGLSGPVVYTEKQGHNQQ